MISSEKKIKANRLTNGSKNDTVDHPKSANSNRHKGQAGMEIKQNQQKKCINLKSSHATFKSCNMYWSFYEFSCYMIREVTGLAMPMMPKRDMVAPSSSLA